MNPFTICHACRTSLRNVLRHSTTRNVSVKRFYTRPTFAPKPVLDLKHIRQNPGLYEQNCLDRNYQQYARNGWRILELHGRLVAEQKQAVEVRQRNNVIGREMKRLTSLTNGEGRRDGDVEVQSLIEEAKKLKGQLQEWESIEREMQEEMERLALELPNLSSMHTPVGDDAEVLGYINGEMPPPRNRSVGRSHVDIGRELDLLDFEASAATSGWGWYFLKNEGALLEHALVQYALSVAMRRGWTVMTPPSLVYGHIAAACGFMPRDQHGETQIYRIAQHQAQDEGSSNAAGLVLAGTAEIPFAGSQTHRTLISSELPLKVVGPSRCYRAEAGARGVDTKGLYRVHEFTKVEMFAWTAPPLPTPDTERFGNENIGVERSQTENLFDEMVDLQKEILTSLGLHARVLEMPTTDLGASPSRKIDIEAWFPSRTAIDNGYGEVTSASICTDYQSRRLDTRVMYGKAEKLGWAYTVNGTALAVPRILAAVLENEWDESSGTVVVPECLRRWMVDGMDRIERKTKR